jgi:cysteine synthase A
VLENDLKEANPHIQIIGADPYGSILGGEDEYKGKPYKVEGIGYDFIPKTCDTRNS